VCIGQGRSGTGWLSDQLHAHPEFWMPPIKELSFFDEENPDGLRLCRKAARMEASREKRLGRAARRGDDRARRFLQQIVAASDRVKDEVFYRSLFGIAEGYKSGDISPAYSRLSPAGAARVAAALPSAKVVLLLRDPVARAWSQVCNRTTGERIPRRLAKLSAADKPAGGEPPKSWRGVREYLEGKHLEISSFPTRIYKVWTSVNLSGRFRYYLLDDIASDPLRMLGDLFSFLGADPAKASKEMAYYNSKARWAKPAMPEEVRSGLVDYFTDELRECARVFGGSATKWPAKYGL
jgi:hypothetical protein